MNILQVHVIVEVAKVPRCMRKQVPMIQEMLKDQMPEEVQTSFSPYLESRTDEVQSKTKDSRCTDVRDARVRKREHQKHSAEVGVRSVAGKLSRKAPTKRSQNSQS